MRSAEAIVADLASSMAMMQIQMTELFKVNTELLKVNTQVLKEHAEEKKLNAELLKRLQISEKRDNDNSKKLDKMYKSFCEEPETIEAQDIEALWRVQDYTSKKQSRKR